MLILSTTRSATINSRRDGDLLGLNASNNGRSCEQHGECCGKAVKADDVIRFKLAVVEDVLGKPLDTIKAVLIKDGTELCTIGFLGREVAALPSQRSKYIDIFAQVIELYDDNENSIMRKKSSKRNAGMASIRLMEDIQE
jgi:hypothetical protein